MNIEEIRTYALSLPGVKESIKWDVHLCFTVGEKMFLITSPDEFPVAASLKTTDALFDSLSKKEGITPAPYLARNKWIKVDDLNRLSTNEWKELINISYTLIFSKLPVKTQKQLTGKKQAK